MQGEEQNWDEERRNTYITVTKYIKKESKYFIFFSGEGKNKIEPGTSHSTLGVTIIALPLE